MSDDDKASGNAAMQGIIWQALDVWDDRERRIALFPRPGKIPRVAVAHRQVVVRQWIARRAAHGFLEHRKALGHPPRLALAL